MNTGQAGNSKDNSYTLFIEDKEYQVDQAEMTGGDIMDLINQIHAIGLVLYEEDGTEVEVVEDDVIDLRPGVRFKEPPRFFSAFHGNLKTEV